MIIKEKDRWCFSNVATTHLETTQKNAAIDNANVWIGTLENVAITMYLRRI